MELRNGGGSGERLARKCRLLDHAVCREGASSEKVVAMMSRLV